MTHAVPNPNRQNALSPIELPCDHPVSLFPAKGGGELPVGLPERVIAGELRVDPMIWCDSCGWVATTTEFFEMVTDFHGGMA